LQIITRNSQEKIYLNIYADGELTQADEIPTLTIYDADTNLIVHEIENVAVLYDTEDGVYYYFIDQHVTSANRTIQVVWRYLLNGVIGYEYDYYKIDKAYADPSEIIDFLGFGSNPSEVNYHDIKEIQSAEKLARTIIDGYTMQTFGRILGSQEQMGNGSDAIQLTERMIRIDKVYENGLLVIDNTVSPAVNNFGFPIEISPTGKAVRIINAGWDVRYDNQVDPTILYYGRFRDGARYKFEGLIGYNYIPEDIKLATMLLVGDIVSNDFNWRNKYLKKVDLSEISFEMAPGAFNGTGNVVVDNILDLYRNHNIVVI
jgi:hypothetical protein